MAGLLDYQRIPNDAEGGSYMHRSISQSPDEDLQQALQESLAQALASGGKCCYPRPFLSQPIITMKRATIICCSCARWFS